MAATTITSNMLGGLRNHVVDMVAYARYKVGSTWYRAEIDSKAVQGNGAVHVAFYLHNPGGTTPASQFQLYNASGQLLSERTENVAFLQEMDVLYRFKFGVSISTTT